ncbi:phosphoribosylaminoimidazole-succinocarboxamide synthase [Kiloniella litopenaei]|uniref:Phosphoribosylaminoimidazole-succinocarboxamide synthase n=1 Tax=Kiloniella litopenaei TaxID=1549748 RepID=A0A0M2RDY2_9PROT|nr:phosphoribosylaminoimidazolesuccinocarboxamide synthase [Kiloniella litopenaei]KKJ78659.1 phosphoribosylaminoimidazole-succinocarboxamide synthase [Kiloniella litopenaei]
MGDTKQDFQQALVNRLTDATYPELPKHYQGKVRDAYDLPDGRRIMIATDRQSAFDRILAAVPHKGQVLNQTARFWFEQTEDICPNHVISFPDPNVVIGRNLEMLPIEMVVRDYMTGSTETSIWPMYQRGERKLYGHDFPEGLKKNQKLPETIITPTTKAAQGDHDAPITAAQIVEQGILSKETWEELARLSLAIFARGREVAAKNGLILVDTKYEFGVDQDGRITLADEIHTPDSSRYWIAESYQDRMDKGLEPESLDKEFLRLWVSQRCDPYKDDIPDIPDETLEIFSEKYINLFERVTGETFKRESFDQPLKDRIRNNLAAILPEYF